MYAFGSAMLKHSFTFMGNFFTRERFGQPQFLAAALLLLFAAQCLWLVRKAPIDEDQLFRIRQGLTQWHGGPLAGMTGLANSDVSAEPQSWLLARNHGDVGAHSPLPYLVAAAPLLPGPAELSADSMPYWAWAARAPYLMFGLLLGASLWYVCRRLYGNAGGYIALTLYSFAPGMIRASSLHFAEPVIGAAWGTFGAVFTAIAVAHTLYAPREVVLWNWRRILLLGLSLALAVGTEFSLLTAVPVALLLMLWVAPARKAAALVIWCAALGFAVVLLFVAYFFHPRWFLIGLQHARFFPFSLQAFGMTRVYSQVAGQMFQACPALILALPAAVVAFLSWKRARYFGNTAPLLLALLFLAMSIATPHASGAVYPIVATTFFFVFVAGVFADLLETSQGLLVTACLWGLLAASSVWNLWQLARV